MGPLGELKEAAEDLSLADVFAVTFDLPLEEAEGLLCGEDAAAFLGVLASSLSFTAGAAVVASSEAPLVGSAADAWLEDVAEVSCFVTLMSLSGEEATFGVVAASR